MNCSVMSKEEKKDKNARSTLPHQECMFLYIWLCIPLVLQVFLEVAHNFIGSKKESKTSSLQTVIFLLFLLATYVKYFYRGVVNIVYL